MIKNIRHLGIIVKDLNESISFYENYFNLKPYSFGIEKGPFIDNLVGLDKVFISWVKLKSENNNVLIELLEYSSHPDLNNIKLPLVGAAHIAFTVDSVSDIYDKLNDKYKCTKPQKSPDEKVMVFYCNGPDGVTLELVEEL